MKTKITSTEISTFLLGSWKVRIHVRLWFWRPLVDAEVVALVIILKN